MPAASDVVGRLLSLALIKADDAAAWTIRETQRRVNCQVASSMLATASPTDGAMLVRVGEVRADLTASLQSCFQENTMPPFSEATGSVTTKQWARGIPVALRVRRGQLLRRIVSLFVPGMVLAFGGCASGIVVTHVEPGQAALKGNPWNLGMTQFKVTITRQVVGCGEQIKGAVEVLVSPTMVLDEQQRYVLVSNGWWATSDITSNLSPTGISTGLNASSTDATATFIGGAVGTIAQIAIGLAAGAAQAPPSVPPPPVQLCNAGVALAVAELYPPAATKKIGLKARVDQNIADLAAATAKLTLLTAQAQSDASYKAQLATALADQAALQSQLSVHQALLAKYIHLTSDTQVVSWPRMANDFRRDEPYLLDDDTYFKWATPNADSAQARGDFGVYLALYRQNLSDGAWSRPGPPPISDVSVGVPVRLAQIGRLLVCVGSKCPLMLAEGQNRNPKQIASDFVVLQLGQLYNVPLTGGTFKAETAVVAMDSNGLPTIIQVSEKAAAGAVLATATKDAATQLAALPAQLRAAELAKTTAQTSQITANVALSTAEANAAAQGETSTLAAQTALLNAQNALATAKANAGMPLQTAAVTAQTALLNAQAALVTAQANSTVTDQTSVLAAQTTLINAQTAQINAAAALAKAQIVKP